jgi:hypothetical protein
LRTDNSINPSADTPLSTPDISLELLTYLDRMFPDSLSLVTRMGSVEAATGARHVIDHLRQLFREQQE